MKPFNLTPDDRAAYVRRLMVFFGVVYFAHGIGQAGDLIAQPLSYFFKEFLGFSPAEQTRFLAILALPALLRPLYGLLSDCVPLFGYRRKSYLYLFNSVCALGCLLLASVTDARLILVALLLTAFGTAASDVLIEALVVEKGRDTGKTKEFQSVQWLWFSAASVGTALLGGWLCQRFAPESALHVAALITLIAPVSVGIATHLTVRETKATVNLGELKETLKVAATMFANKSLWSVAAFLILWHLTPAFSTPLYYYMVDELRFSQDFIGLTVAVNALGGVAGTLLFGRYLAPRFSDRMLAVIGVLAYGFGTLTYLALSGHASALVLSFLAGAYNMVGFLMIISLVADVCPKKAEAFAFAAMMALCSIPSQISAVLGSHLYEHLFAGQLAPLVVTAAVFSLLALLFVPLLPVRRDETG